MSKRFQGFTLVEIMIVVAIIAILAAVAIPNFIKYRDDARCQSCVANMHQLQTAAESYLTSNPMASGTINIADICGTDTSEKKYYLKKEPKCPSDSSSYTITVENGAVVVTCGSGDAKHTLTPGATGNNGGDTPAGSN